jgi:AraC-like DNA-binding protein
MAHAARDIGSGVKIEAVSKALGYRSRQTFYRQFKDTFGANPTHFRQVSAPRSVKAALTFGAAKNETRFPKTPI